MLFSLQTSPRVQSVIIGRPTRRAGSDDVLALLLAKVRRGKSKDEYQESRAWKDPRLPRLGSDPATGSPMAITSPRAPLHSYSTFDTLCFTAY
jgi:hypothetical protein